MIKFFRHIRQSLIMKNQTGKYLKYAIGEIILVVIGILIALQINNWNEARKETFKERQLLNNLRIEFQDNLTDLDSIALEVDKVILALENVFSRFNPNITKPVEGLDQLLSDALNSPNWRPSEYLLNNLSNSGGIANLKNEQLKLLLYKWSRLQNQMHEVDMRTEQTGDEIIAYLKQHASLRNIDTKSGIFDYRKSNLVEDNSKLLSDPLFENYIDDKLYMYQSTQRILLDARELLVKLIEETKR